MLFTIAKARIMTFGKYCACVPVTYALLGSVVGILYSRFNSLSLLLMIIFAVVFILGWWRSKYDMWILFIFFMGVFLWRANVFWNQAEELDTSQRLEYSGQITREPSYKERYSSYTIKEQNGTRILVYAPKYPLLVYGDQVSFTCQLESTEEIGTQKPELLGYKNYLDHLNIHYQCLRPEKWRVITEEDDPMPMSWITKIISSAAHFKLTLWQEVAYELSYPYADILINMVIGFPQELPGYDDLFRQTGVSHVLSVSGFNVTLFMAGAIALLKPFGKRWQLRGSVIMVVMFLLLAGFSAPALRAGVMGVLSLLGLISGQHRQIGVLLVWSVIIMLVIDPSYLFMVSLHLSVAAVAGIVWLSPVGQVWLRVLIIKLHFSRWWQWIMRIFFARRYFLMQQTWYWPVSEEYINTAQFIRTSSFGAITWQLIRLPKLFVQLQRMQLKGDWLGIESAATSYFVITVAATIATLGIIATTFGQISGWSIIANIAILWVVELVGIVGIIWLLLVALSHWWSFTVVKWGIALLNIILIGGIGYFLTINQLLSRLYSASFTWQWGTSGLVLYYLVLVLFVLLFYPIAYDKNTA